MIANIPWVFSPPDTSALAVGIVEGGLVAAALIFEAVVNDINSYGTLGGQFDEAIAEEIQRRMELEIDRVMKEQAH
jgi:O-acetyl-ADP-ribose deacetylase (regulator of RNase III)